MISKELLESVLGDTYKERLVDIIVIDDNVLQTLYDCGSGKPTCLGMEINVYELAHKCKEWAWNKHSVRIESGRMYGVNEEVWNAVISVYNGHVFYVEDSAHWEKSNTEPDSVFKACQWILDNKVA